MIADCDQFWSDFEQHLLTATRRFHWVKPDWDVEAVFQRLMCCQLAALGAVGYEEEGFKALFSPCPTGEYLPDHLGGVDLTLMPCSSSFDPKTAVGLELKVFSVDKTNDYKQVQYFATGNFSSESQFSNGYGEFLQHGCLTYCKEGQLLQDYCRAARILARQEREFFICCGVMRYRDVSAALIEERIESLLARFRCRPVLYRYRYDNERKFMKFMICAKLNQREQSLSSTVKVLATGQPEVYAYYVVVRRS